MLCDYITNLDDESPQAKKLRNRPIHTYTCPTCEERITKRTLERLETGKFKLYRDKQVEDEW